MNKSYNKIRHIQETNLKLENRLTESNRKKFVNEQESNESLWNRLFHKPTVDDATHDQLRGKGHSFRGKDEDERHYVVHDGKKYYEDDIEHADYDDMDEIPRVVGDKLIIPHPRWED